MLKNVFYLFFCLCCKSKFSQSTGGTETKARTVKMILSYKFDGNRSELTNRIIMSTDKLTNFHISGNKSRKFVPVLDF